MYFEFLFLRAHSRRRVDRMYWSGCSLNSFTTCSNSVMVGTTGPMGSGLPQLGLPRRFAMCLLCPISSEDVFRMTVVLLAMPWPGALTDWIHETSTTIHDALPGFQNHATGEGYCLGQRTTYYSSNCALSSRQISPHSVTSTY